ncbi:MAG: lipid II flippase MurJ, partial [Terracidiphilus sp.]
QAFLGVVGAVVIYHLAPFIVDHIHVQRGNRELGLLALRLFACSIPIDFANLSLTGVMQAGQRFDWVNGLSILNTLSTYCAYGIGILRGNDFATVVTALFAFKIVNLLATYYGATKVLPRLLSLSHLRGLTDSYWPRAVALVRYGWWVAAAALVAPMLVQFDSWMISFLLGVSLLPFFTVPTGLLWRLGFLPSSLSTPLFPAFSAMEARTEWGRIENYFVRAHRYLLVLLIPVLLVLFIWGEELLRLWVGAPFARQAALPLRLLIPGFLIGLVAPLSGTLLEAVAVALWLIVYRLVPFPGSGFFKRGVLMAAASALVFLPAALGIRATRVTSFADLAATVGTLLIYAIYAYRFVFDARDRQFTAAFVRSKARSFAEKCGIRRPVLDTDGRALDCGPVE